MIRTPFSRNVLHELRLLRVCVATFQRQRCSKKDDKIKLPPEPTTCCMSGCPNCVWVEYAQTIAKLLEGNTDQAREIVLSKISDPNLRVFLEIELKLLKQKINSQNDKKNKP